MIKAIVSDVDGVINGSLEGINTPLPHRDVIKALHFIDLKKIPVILCTTKGLYPIIEIVDTAQIGGVHIADGGAIIYNGLTKKVTVDNISLGEVVKIIDSLKKTNNYFEVYTAEQWYILEKFENKYINNHTVLLRKAPIRIKSFKGLMDKLLVSKIFYFSEEPIRSKANTALMNLFNDANELKWTKSPVLEPANLLAFTKIGVSKKNALLKIAKELNIDFADFLGIGDNKADWGFMELCGFVGAMGNSSQELLKSIEQKSRQHRFIGGHVDNNGFIDILNNFKLI